MNSDPSYEDTIFGEPPLPGLAYMIRDEGFCAVCSKPLLAMQSVRGHWNQLVPKVFHYSCADSYLASLIS